MKIGVITDCFKVGPEAAIRKAGAMRLDGVQIYATTGEFSPTVLTDKRKQQFLTLLQENHLVISALCGDLGGHGFEIEADNPARIELTRRIIDLAVEMGTGIVTTHIGVIPSDPSHPRYVTMLSAMRACGSYAARRGVTLAIETGPEPARTLRRFVEDAGEGVGVNLDPANFVMVTGQDPVEAVELLAEKIVHTHVKDGRMLSKTDPKIIYDCFADGGIEALNVADYFMETPIGHGDVRFDAYFRALDKIGYRGFYTIERETGADAEADIRLAVEFLRNQEERKHE